MLTGDAKFRRCSINNSYDLNSIVLYLCNKQNRVRLYAKADSSHRQDYIGLTGYHAGVVDNGSRHLLPPSFLNLRGRTIDLPYR
jgi:hypothetical protein